MKKSAESINVDDNATQKAGKKNLKGCFSQLEKLACYDGRSTRLASAITEALTFMAEKNY